jgi:hypothetical protein
MLTVGRPVEYALRRRKQGLNAFLRNAASFDIATRRIGLDHREENH